MTELQSVTLPALGEQDQRREVTIVTSQIVALEVIDEAKYTIACNGGHLYRVPMSRAKALAEICKQLDRQNR